MTSKPVTAPKARHRGGGKPRYLELTCTPISALRPRLPGLGAGAGDVAHGAVRRRGGSGRAAASLMMEQCFSGSISVISNAASL